MAEKSTFFNSVNGDRKYKAEDMAAHFAKVLTNGVMPAGKQLQVIENSGMNVTISAGSAWINGYAYHNDASFVLAIDPADGALNRVDRIVVRWNRLARSINLTVLKGTPASSATAPDIVRNADYYDLSIATINVNKGITAITQALITDTRMDSDVCGFVSSLIQPDTSGWFVQFETAFNEWFDGVKDTLGDNAAGQLQNQINQLKYDDDQIRALETKLPEDIASVLGLDPADNPRVKDGVLNAYGRVGDIRESVNKGIDDKWILCDGTPVRKNQALELYKHDNSLNKAVYGKSYVSDKKLLIEDYLPNSSYQWVRSLDNIVIYCMGGHIYWTTDIINGPIREIDKSKFSSGSDNLYNTQNMGVSYIDNKYIFVYTASSSGASDAYKIYIAISTDLENFNVYYVGYPNGYEESYNITNPVQRGSNEFVFYVTRGIFDSKNAKLFRGTLPLNISSSRNASYITILDNLEKVYSSSFSYSFVYEIDGFHYLMVYKMSFFHGAMTLIRINSNTTDSTVVTTTGEQKTSGISNPVKYNNKLYCINKPETGSAKLFTSKNNGESWQSTSISNSSDFSRTSELYVNPVTNKLQFSSVESNDGVNWSSSNISTSSKTRTLFSKDTICIFEIDRVDGYVLSIKDISADILWLPEAFTEDTYRYIKVKE